MSKVLVTGATGFVGRHLCSSLVDAGFSVRAVYVTTPPPLEASSGIEWLKIESIGPTTDWSRALAGGITQVVHLAAVAHRIAPRDRVPDQLFDQVNHLGTSRLVEAVVEARSVERLIFLSSIGAVASLSDETVNEQTPCYPASVYGLSKLAGEKAVQRVLASTKVEWCILRPPLLYGAGNPGNMERLLKLLPLSIPLPLKSVQNRRTFLYVGNLVDAILLALQHPAATRRIFCIADNETLSTAELLKGLGEAAGRPVILFPFPLGGLRLLGALGDLVFRVTGRSVGLDRPMIEKLCGSLPVDNSLFCETCGWAPPFSVQEGLRKTVAGLT